MLVYSNAPCLPWGIVIEQEFTMKLLHLNPNLFEDSYHFALSFDHIAVFLIRCISPDGNTLWEQKKRVSDMKLSLTTAGQKAIFYRAFSDEAVYNLILLRGKAAAPWTSQLTICVFRFRSFRSVPTFRPGASVVTSAMTTPPVVLPMG